MKICWQIANWCPPVVSGKAVILVVTWQRTHFPGLFPLVAPWKPLCGYMTAFFIGLLVTTPSQHKDNKQENFTQTYVASRGWFATSFIITMAAGLQFLLLTIFSIKTCKQWLRYQHCPQKGINLESCCPWRFVPGWLWTAPTGSCKKDFDLTLCFLSFIS